MSEEKPGAKKYDQVAMNSIWREHCMKERSLLTLNENFRLNPHALAANMITGKPNVDPARTGEKIETSSEIIGPKRMFGAHTSELDGILKETKKVPTAKYSEPIASSHEYGWYSVPLMQNRKKMGIKNCDITAYANDYTQAMGRNPFATKEPIVKGA